MILLSTGTHSLCCTFMFFYISAFIHLKIRKHLKSSNWGQFPLSSQSLFLAFPLLNKPLLYDWLLGLTHLTVWSLCSRSFFPLHFSVYYLARKWENLRGPSPFKSYHTFSRFPVRVLLLYMFWCQHFTPPVYLIILILPCLLSFSLSLMTFLQIKFINLRASKSWTSLRSGLTRT